MAHLKGKFRGLIKGLFTKMCTEVRKPRKEGEVSLDYIKSLLPLSEGTRKHMVTTKN